MEGHAAEKCRVNISLLHLQHLNVNSSEIDSGSMLTHCLQVQIGLRHVQDARKRVPPWLLPGPAN